jgi:hypothetical protein
MQCVCVFQEKKTLKSQKIIELTKFSINLMSQFQILFPVHTIARNYQSHDRFLDHNVYCFLKVPFNVSKKRLMPLRVGAFFKLCVFNTDSSN